MDNIMRKPPRNRRKMQSVTMSDVAELANVSPSTVSLFLRKPEAVSATASQAISRAIDKLNYVPNLMAGGLAAASSRAVSILVPSVRNAFFAETVSSMQTALKKQRLQLILGHTEYDEQEEEELVRMALSWAPAAVVLTGLSHSAATRRLLANVAIPVIEIWELGGPQIDTAIGFHHDQVGVAAAEHLIGQGRRNLLFLGAVPSSAATASCRPPAPPGSPRRSSSTPTRPRRKSARCSSAKPCGSIPIPTASLAPTTTSRSAPCSPASARRSPCRTGSPWSASAIFPSAPPAIRRSPPSAPPAT